MAFCFNFFDVDSVHGTGQSINPAKYGALLEQKQGRCARGLCPIVPDDPASFAQLKVSTNASDSLVRFVGEPNVDLPAAILRFLLSGKGSIQRLNARNADRECALA